MSEEFVKVRFGEGETGWAEAMGDRFRIANIPLAEDLNIDDIVSCEIGNDGFFVILDVLERKFKYKSYVKYDNADQYYLIRDKIKEFGYKVEGMVMGFCTVAHDGNFSRNQILSEIGVKTEQYEEESVLVD